MIDLFLFYMWLSFSSSVPRTTSAVTQYLPNYVVICLL